MVDSVIQWIPMLKRSVGHDIESCSSARPVVLHFELMTGDHVSWIRDVDAANASEQQQDLQ